MAEIKRPRVQKARQAYVQATLAGTTGATRQEARKQFEELSKTMKGRTQIVQTAGLAPEARKQTKRAIAQYAATKSVPASTSGATTGTTTNMRSSTVYTTAQVTNLLSTSGPRRAATPGTSARQYLKPIAGYQPGKVSSRTAAPADKPYENSAAAKWLEEKNVPVLRHIAPGARALASKNYGSVAGSVATAAFEKSLLKGGVKVIAGAGKKLLRSGLGQLWATRTNTGQVVTGLGRYGSQQLSRARTSLNPSRFSRPSSSVAPKPVEPVAPKPVEPVKPVAPKPATPKPATSKPATSKPASGGRSSNKGRTSTKKGTSTKGKNKVKTNPKVETAPETPTGVRTAKNTPSQEQFTDEALRRMAQNPATRDKAIRIIEARRAAAGAKGGSTQGSAQMRAALAQARSKRAYKPTGRGFIN